MILTIIPIAIPNNKLLNKMAMIVIQKGINWLNPFLNISLNKLILAILYPVTISIAAMALNGILLSKKGIC